MPTIHIAKMHPDVKFPTKRDGDGCYDIYCYPPEYIKILPHAIAMIPTGIKSTFSNEYRISIRERGSNTKSGLIVMAGQIDSNYTGEWFVAVYNTNDKPVLLSPQYAEYGEDMNAVYVPVSKAIAQFAVEEIPFTMLKEVSEEEIDSLVTERGQGKLGSSGK